MSSSDSLTTLSITLQAGELKMDSNINCKQTNPHLHLNLF